MGTLKEIISEHITYKNQLLKLAKSDIEKTYRGAALGWAWAIIKPAVTIFVYWFAFDIGLRHGKDIDGYPFFLWLCAGICPWFYMSEMITGGANCLRTYSHLVTKMKFPVSTIPTFVSISSITVNIGLLAIIIGVFMLNGYMPHIYYIQLIYYMACMFFFFTCWAMFAGMISALSKDFLNLVKSMITAVFWLSGILYDPRTINHRWIRILFKFNPVTYLASGYRESMIYKKWFWERIWQDFSL